MAGERFFRVPYRWAARPFANLRDCIYTLFVWFPRNVWRYRAWNK